MKSALTWAAAVTFTLAASGAALAQNDPRVTREGDGARRTALNDRELKAFPMDAWSSLSAWSGNALTAKEIEGKPVMIVTWSHWYRPSWDALRTAQRLHEQHGKDGLIVVGVHAQQQFDGAAKFFSDRGFTFPYAHDASGAFRAELDVDQDPDIYIIDRAGQLRFADILTSAAETAVSIVVKESAADAAAIPGNLAAKAAQAEEASRRTREVADSEKPGQTLDVPFEMPPASAYEAAKWPEKNTAGLSANDFQGQALPAALGNETWITERPSMNGRVIVLDFWATWCGPCIAAMPALDAMQKQHKRDLVIVGMSGGGREDVGTIRRFLRTHKSAYSHANDMKQTVSNAMQIRGIPHVVVLSTDGIIRWQGNPHDKSFRAAVEQVIREDPGVKARRAAEDAYLKTQRASR